MARFIIKRIAVMVPMILGVTMLVFFLLSVTPSNPGRIMLGASATQEQVDQVNEELGYYDPLPVRYLRWVWDALRGDFGKSWFNKRSVMAELGQRIPVTLTLGLVSLAFSVLAGISLGMLSAVRQYSFLDHFFSIFAIFWAAVPAFWLALMLLQVFSNKLGLVPASGIANGLKSWILPIVTVSIPGASGIMRFTRSAMLDTIGQEYTRTARAKGAKEATVIWKHAFRNALLPIITVVGMRAGYMMCGGIVVEQVFSMPGIGTLVMEAIRRKDVPLVMGSITTLALYFMLVMLVVDVSYALADPRIRSKYRRAPKLPAAGQGGAV